MSCLRWVAKCLVTLEWEERGVVVVIRREDRGWRKLWLMECGIGLERLDNCWGSGGGIGRVGSDVMIEMQKFTAVGDLFNGNEMMFGGSG